MIELIITSLICLGKKTRKATLAHIEHSKKQKESKQPQKISSGYMLAASYYTGNGFTSDKTILNMSGLTTQSRATFFHQQAKGEDNLIKSAEELMVDAREDFSGHCAIGCRWSSPRRGIHGTVSMVDVVNHKVIEYSTMIKKGKIVQTVNMKGVPTTWKRAGPVP